ERRKVTGIERNFYVVRLLTAIIAILDQASIPLGEVFGSEQYNIIVQTSQIYDKNKLLHHIKQEMIHPIAKAITNKNQSGGSEIAKQVIRMIKESKGNITLNECAESLNYHPNYIWKVLKKETGQNFTDLAGNEKLELAKFMLLTTDYAIAEISDKLQYTNVQSFIRFFKSHTETTPASFRKAHKH
ncbi:MAG: helix-turn-helix transcriptional regulator, partial [Hungatella sp.]